MNEVVVSKSINVPAQKAWNALSSFRGIEHYSPVERSEAEGSGAGTKRTLYMPDGAVIHEELNYANNEAMEMQYKITEGPFPIQGYVGEIKVSSAGENSCKVTWGCEFNSEEAVKTDMENLFTGLYTTVIDQLEGYLQN